MPGTRRLLAAAALLATGFVLPISLAPTSTASVVNAPLGQSGRWITDASGRVVVLHGLNQVYKIAPYEPSAAGFGADDAAFLAANGFNAMRIGVIWAAVE